MEKNNELRKIYNVLIIICVLLAINTFILLFVNTSDTNKSSSENNENSEINNNYDVSKMTEVNEKELLELFNDKDTKVVYIGRPSCSACVTFVPTLNQVHDELGFDLYYLNSENLGTDQESLSELAKKLDKEITINTTSGEESGKYGEYLGTTPMLFIIKNGKMLDGIIGAYSYDSLKSFLNNNGIN